MKETLDTDAVTVGGLSASQVEQSRREHGENVLTPPKPVSMWKLYMEKYQDPIIRILLVAAVISLEWNLQAYCLKSEHIAR